uniref:Putative homing endonuclease n=1 Tax=viral metagenome TaxID=1070528 RepID=A0A6H1ZMC1_9ZZZZ
MNLNRSEIRSAIIGMVIGDGCLSKRYENGNAYYQMTHKEGSYEYMLWKQKILNKITSSTIHPTKRILNGKTFKGYHLGTKRHPIFTKLYNRFYYKKVKVLDEYLVKSITPLAFAIMYMDDGTYGNANKKSDSFFLCTQNFDYANQLLLKKSLKIKFNLDWNLNKANVRKDGTYNYRLRLANRCNEDFLNIISMYVDLVPCMKYKLGSHANISLKDIDIVRPT